MKLISLSIIVVVALGAIGCHAQEKQIVVEKIPFQGKQKIILKYQDDTSKLQAFNAGCEIRKFTYLPDATKIKAIEQLLSFENDTSISASTVTQYNTGYFKGERPVSKQYTLQVEALFYINYLALSAGALYYSPFPVLYDTISKREVNVSNADIKEVYSEYKKWFEEIRQRGFINYTVPLKASQYKWFGTVDKKDKFASYPYWRKDDGCKNWED